MKRPLKWAKDRFIRVIRLAMRQGTTSGWPDTIFLIPGGRPAFIEWKRPGKRPSRLQDERISWLEAQGYDVGWCYDADEAIEWLEERRKEGQRRLLEEGAGAYTLRPG